MGQTATFPQGCIATPYPPSPPPSSFVPVVPCTVGLSLLQPKLDCDDPDVKQIGLPTRTAEVKVVIVGGSCCGKTALFWRLLTGDLPEEPSPATKPDLRLRYLTDINSTVALWDLPGKFHGSDLQYRSCCVCLLVYDTGDERSAEALSVWLTEALRLCPAGCEYIFVGNMKGCAPHPQVMSVVQKLATPKYLRNFIVDPKTGQGIAELCRHIKISILKYRSSAGDAP
ncbi:hypothetical protein Pelo_12653 [Pelomyxa schiedti]|nr:hypothetical protein Pelo_12653 [Pelomyxa schiedti]